MSRLVKMISTWLFQIFTSNVVFMLSRPDSIWYFYTTNILGIPCKRAANCSSLAAVFTSWGILIACSGIFCTSRYCLEFGSTDEFLHICWLPQSNHGDIFKDWFPENHGIEMFAQNSFGRNGSKLNGAINLPFWLSLGTFLTSEMDQN